MRQNPSRHPTSTHCIADDGSVAVDSYVLTFESEHFYRRRRYHWMICAARNPDELVSWGHAPTQELAETVARNEVEKLAAGLTESGQVTSASKSAVGPKRHGIVPPQSVRWRESGITRRH